VTLLALYIAILNPTRSQDKKPLPRSFVTTLLSLRSKGEIVILPLTTDSPTFVFPEKSSQVLIYTIEEVGEGDKLVIIYKETV